MRSSRNEGVLTICVLKSPRVAALLHLQQATVSTTGSQEVAAYIGGGPTRHLVGESINAEITWRGGRVSIRYEPRFPMFYNNEAIPAMVNTDLLLSSLLQEAGCTQANLVILAETEHDEHLRIVAVGLLTDQAALAKIAVENSDWTAREAAVGKLTD